MKSFQNNKGAVSVSYAALIVFSVGALVAISPFYGHFVPLCDSGPLDYVCEGSITGESGGSSGESDDSEIVIGDNEYDPDPSTPMRGPWVFGAGQAFNKNSPTRVSYPGKLSAYNDRNLAFDHPDADYVLATAYETGYTSSDGDWIDDPYGEERTTVNEWFNETRSLELDDSVDCSQARISEDYSGYCQALIRLPAQSVSEGFDHLAWTNGDPYTIDYGEFAFDSLGESVVLDLRFLDAQTALFSRQPYDLETQLKIYMDSDENSINLGNNDNLFLDIEGRGNQTSISIGDESTLALGDGLFETNNGRANKPWYSYSNYLNHGIEHRYEPKAGGVVAAYPYIVDYSYLDGFGAIYERYRSDNGHDQHRVDLSHVDGWTIKECVVEAVPFIRELEPEETQTDSDYDTLRADIGATGPRKGATVILENGSGETWKLIHVDRPAFTDPECSLDNDDLFVR